jgi:hypothetical protein
MAVMSFPPGGGAERNRQSPPNCSLTPHLVSRHHRVRVIRAVLIGAEPWWVTKVIV